MPNLLATLTADAEQLVEGQLPTANELRSVVGALVHRLEQAAPALLDDALAPVKALPGAPQSAPIGTPVVVPPAPEPAAAAAPVADDPIVFDKPASPAAPDSSAELAAVRAELAQAQAQLAVAQANANAPQVSA